jgi:4-amino-4-deoxy-L-arabinose transferase-like glycosyltransferase
LSSITTTAPLRARSLPVWRTETLAVAVLTLAALLLRLTSLSRSLFADEAYSLALAQRSFGHMVELFGYEANGTPYSIVLWPLIRIFGTGEALLRAPAVLAGTASVPVLWWAARRYATPAVGLLAAALLAINPMAVWYSQLARPYAFVVLAACLAFGTLPRALESSGGRRPWAGYVAAMVALAYCEILAAPIALPAHALLARRAGREPFRRWMFSLLAVLLCCVPLLVASAISRSRRNALYWLPKPGRGLVTLAVQEFTGGFSGVSAVRWATLLAGALLLAGAVWAMRRPRVPGERGTLLIAACWGLLPGALLMAVSFVRPVFWPRYAIMALPGLCLLVALAAERLWRERRFPVAVAGCLAVIFAAGAIADAKQRSALQEDWPPAGALMRAERAPGQPTIIDNLLVLPALGYYDPAFRARNGDLIVQEWKDLPLPSGVVGYKDPGGYGTVPDGPPSAATFQRLAAAGKGTVWMVVAEADKDLQGDPREGAAVTWARGHCQIQTHESFGVWVLRATGCRA